MTRRILLACTPFYASAFAQPASRAAFDVASVKLGDANGRGRFQVLPGGTVIVENAPLKLLIQQAYDVREFQVSGGPSWIVTQRYSIIGKVGDSTPANASADPRYDLMRQRLQSLLEDRFQLKLHRETRDMIAFSLVVAKNGPRLKETVDGTASHMGRGIGKLNGQAVDMRFLAIWLSRFVGRTVFDETGLTGAYDFELVWTPDSRPPSPDADPPASDQNGASIFTAVQEQLGLKLVSKKGPVEFLVIDRVEKASEN